MGFIICLSILLMVGMFLCIMADETDSSIAIYGMILIVCCFIGMYFAGRDYYESKIPDIKEQVQLYNIEIAEKNLLELKG